MKKGKKRGNAPAQTETGILRFIFNDEKTEKGLVVVEARDKQEAISRFQHVARLIDMPQNTTINIRRHKGPVHTAFFAHGFFLMREAAEREAQRSD